MTWEDFYRAAAEGFAMSRESFNAERFDLSCAPISVHKDYHQNYSVQELMDDDAFHELMKRVWDRVSAAGVFDEDECSDGDDGPLS